MTLSTVSGANANTFHRTTGWPTPTSLSATHYIEYSITLGSGQTFPDSSLNLAMSVQTSSATAAPTRLQVRYGYGASPTFANAGTAQTIGTTTTNPSVTIPAPGNTTTTQLTIRLHGYNSTSATGNLRIITSTLTGSAPLVPDPPTITGAATATAFTATYGTPSAAQTFSVSGANLTANLTATAPTGFEVASDGATYGGTATFTQSAGSASGTLSVRLKRNAAVSGTYNSQNIVLSSTGATAVNIVTSSTGNSVSPKGLAITASDQSKTYGSALLLGTSAFTSTGLENSETIGSVTLTSYGSGTTAGAGDYDITPSAASGGTFTAANYSITYNTGTLTVDPKPLTITADTVTKPFGATLASPVTGSSSFTSSGLVGSETIGSVTITYGTGSAPEDLAGAYPNQVTPSLAVGGSFDIGNYALTYVSATLTVTADPTITLTGSLAALSTTYGTPSSVTSFGVSGIFLTGDLTISPPSGFEVSLSPSSGFTTSLSVDADGTLPSTTVYVRLSATTVFGTYFGDVTVSGGGAISKTIATESSSVGKKSLTITGLVAQNKDFDNSTTVTVNGTPEYVGLVNGETFVVSGVVTWAFPNASVGADKALDRSGTYDTPSANYVVTQPSLTASIVAVIPGAPTVTSLTPGNGQLSVAFTAPGSNGGVAITNYEYSTDGGATFFARSPVSVTSPIVITTLSSDGTTPLTVGTSYTVLLRAVNSVGSSAASNSASGSPLGVPSVPTSVVVTPGFQQLTITFTAPASNGGSVITNYKYSTNGGSSFVTVSPASTATTIVVTGLTNGTSYNVQVRAVNAIGDGVASESVAGTPARPYYPMASGNFSENFSDVNNWTNGFAAGTGAVYWSPVAVNATGVIPDGSRTTVSSATFQTTASTGGIQRGNLTGNPAGTFVMLSTGTAANANAVAVDLQLDFTGRTVGTLTFDYSCVFNNFTSGDNRGAALRVYGSTDGTTWTALPAAFVSVVNGVAVSATVSAVTLPSSFTNHPSARVRFYQHANNVGNAGSRPKIAIDNVTVTSKVTPTISTSPTASTIVFGQSLASSVLTGGSASVPGTFAFTSPTNTPSIGTASQSVTFTPTDSAAYTSATTTTSVTVIAVYDSWSGDFPGFTDTGESSNPDSDSLSNLLEFAFGTNPTISNSGLISYADGQILANGLPATSVTNITNGVDYRAVFGRRKDHVAAGLTYTVQFSAGLDIWVDSTDTPTVVASDDTMEAVTVPYPFFIETARGVEKPTFFRVAVTSN